MAKNAPKFFNIMYNFYPPIEDLSISSRLLMEYLYFPEQSLSSYDLNGSLLNHSRISQNNRARLFIWLSEECYKQKMSRYSFALTCSYIDLFFMNKKDVELKNYQLLAVGALILASKQIQTKNKMPAIDLQLFKADQLLGMEKDIVYALDFYLNPPIYIELLNNIAKMWDMKCESGEIQSELRYFKEKKESYLRLKMLYEKMDCLNLFKRILDFKLQEVVVTLFYLQTKVLDSEISKAAPKSQVLLKGTIQNPEEEDEFQAKFNDFLLKSQITTKINPKMIKTIKLLMTEEFPINDSTPNNGKTFTHMLSYHTHNKNSIDFYKKYQPQISKI